MKKSKKSQNPPIHNKLVSDFRETIREHKEDVKYKYEGYDDKDRDDFIKKEHDRVARHLLSSTLASIDHIIKVEYPDVEKKKKRELPYDWMIKDTKIKKVITDVDFFIPIDKLFLERNRYWRGEEFKAMVAEADKLTSGERYTRVVRYKPEGSKRYVKYEVECYYSTFLTSHLFYRRTCNKLGCSISTLKRHIRARVTIGYIKELWSGRRREGVLYADGYFMRMPDDEFGNRRYKKISFLKNTKEIRAGLRRLPELVKEYQKPENLGNSKRIKRR